MTPQKMAEGLRADVVPETTFHLTRFQVGLCPFKEVA